MPYERCIFYTVLLAVVALDRPTLKSKAGWGGGPEAAKQTPPAGRPLLLCTSRTSTHALVGM
jgi:hypothetical protein